jgi:ubiquitin-conjugating enzyme E2 variant
MSESDSTNVLPVHDQLSWVTRGIEVTCIVVAVGLAGWHIARFFSAGSFWVWWSLFPILAGLIAADLVSGIVHWTADTWGSETMPVLGRRFVRPFRVHHVNPDDFLRRDLIDTNGDVAMIVSFFLVLAFWLPLEKGWGQAAALFLVSFCLGGLPTNQVHQWAHMPNPPRLVRRLQQWGLILSHTAHQRHHSPPYVRNYCIATGWCNPLLMAIDFFPRMERLVSRISGLQPRSDDQSFAHSVMKSCPESFASPPWLSQGRAIAEENYE